MVLLNAQLRSDLKLEGSKIEEPWNGDIELTYSITEGE
jgi:hypothetical protein